jgi:CelD/BcsL family acetyltransferase involved in cellulose biosynthesis
MIEVWTGERDAPTLLGLLPLCIDAPYGRMPVRHVLNWLHFHSFLGAPLIRAGHEQSFWEAALEALDADRWARGFLHVQGLGENGPAHRGLIAAAQALGRPCDTVHRAERALLASTLSAQDYYERTVRKKKRKELKRLSARLAESGQLEFRTLADAAELEPWCDAFLVLEGAGWKGAAKTALGCDSATHAFFREAVAGAFASGQLDFLRLDLDGRPIAMLVNFLSAPGSFSFKIAYDEDLARFSPGVLIQIENLRVLERGDVEWMDSCAVEDHPMINSLWAERRAIVRATVPLKGWRRGIEFRLCRFAEDASAALRRMRRASKSEADDHE